jgi:hypothetical protein
LKVSLESSERIRNQQKELIAVLQKSQFILGGANGTTPAGQDASVITFNSGISSISHKGENESTQVVGSNALSSNAIATMNHTW